MPKQWLSSGPEINGESIGAWLGRSNPPNLDPDCSYLALYWLGDLQDRLNFLYSWAVEGPPLVIPLGLLARPKSYLTALLQIHAERLDVSVGKLTFECKILCEGHEDLPLPEQLSPNEAASLWLHLSPDPPLLPLQQQTTSGSMDGIKAFERKSNSGPEVISKAPRPRAELRVSLDGNLLGEAFPSPSPRC